MLGIWTRRTAQSTLRQWPKIRFRKPYSTSPNQPPSPPKAPGVKESSDATTAANPRIERMHNRMPKFLRPYTEGLRNAPISHITSFAILHELTAIVPLFGLGAYFYYSENLPAFVQGKYVNDGVQKIGNWFRKKGWLGKDESLGEDGQTIQASTRRRWWGRGENGVKLVTSLGAAWAVTKVLLPARIIASVWLTPFFARKAVIPITRSIKRFFGGKT